MEIISPKPARKPDGTLDIWPTLGPQVIDFIESHFVFGPGPLQGQPYKVREDFRYILMRAYEYFPEGHKSKYEDEYIDMSGRRHFYSVNVAVPKGCAKTELGAIIALCELHPEAPVRFNGYDPSMPGGLAPGIPVQSPYIPFFAPTKELLFDLGYGVAMEIAKEIPDADWFDVTQERIMVQGEVNSKALPLAATSRSAEGLKPTFVVFDETHMFTSEQNRKAYSTVVHGLPKLGMFGTWKLSITTAGHPSEDSIAKSEFEEGVKNANKKHLKIDDCTTFFYHRQTSDELAKFDTIAQRLKALREAAGPATWRDLLATAKLWDEEGADRSRLERVWCNRWVASSMYAFDRKKFADLGDPDLRIPHGSLITIGFDGAKTQDSTAIVITDINTGVQQLAGLWERPPKDDPASKNWEVPVSEVEATIEALFEDFEVYWMFADPPYWQEQLSAWAGRWEKKVIFWYTNKTNPMYYALRSYKEAIDSGDVAHTGNPDLERHIGNAGKNLLNQYDDESNQKWRLTKIKRELKYDAAMAAVLSWEARLQALAKGAAEIETDFLQVPIRLGG